MKKNAIIERFFHIGLENRLNN